MKQYLHLIKKLLISKFHVGNKTTSSKKSAYSFVNQINNNYCIFDLNKILFHIKIILKFIQIYKYNITLRNSYKKEKILLIGTSKKKKTFLYNYVKKFGQKTNNFYYNNEWLEGSITNYKYIYSMNNWSLLVNKENLIKRRQGIRLFKSFEGIISASPLGIIIILNTNQDYKALDEVLKKNFLSIILADSNIDVNKLQYFTPGNNNDTSCFLLGNLINSSLTQNIKKKVFLKKKLPRNINWNNKYILNKSYC